MRRAILIASALLLALMVSHRDITADVATQIFHEIVKILPDDKPAPAPVPLPAPDLIAPPPPPAPPEKPKTVEPKKEEAKPAESSGGMHIEIHNPLGFPAADVEQIRAHYRIVTTGINQLTGQKVEMASGTGIAIGPFHILTAAHVLAGGPYALYSVELYDERGQAIRMIDAKCQKISVDIDLGLLTTSERLPYVNELDLKFDKVKLLDWVFTVGCKYTSQPYNVNYGTLTGMTTKNFPLYWITSVPVVGGNSGGGLYHQFSGKLLGVVVRGQGCSLVVPLLQIKYFLESKDTNVPNEAPKELSFPPAAGKVEKSATQKEQCDGIDNENVDSILDRIRQMMNKK